MRRLIVALAQIVLVVTALRAQAPALTPMDGKATDVGVGAGGVLWAIGIDPVPGGRTIHRWTGSGWETVPGGAVRIAVDPQGAAWVLNEAHMIFKWNGTAWDQMPGAAIDVAIGADGTVWVLNPAGTPHRWMGSSWMAIEGQGQSIAVGPKGGPWVVTAAGGTFRYERVSKTWVAVPGQAKDLAIAADGAVYKVGAPGGRIFRLDNGQWTPVTSSGVGERIAAGPAGVLVVARDDRGLLAAGTLAAVASIPSVGPPIARPETATPPPPATSLPSATIAIPPPASQSISVPVQTAPVAVTPNMGVMAVEAPGAGPAWRALPGGATDVGMGSSGILWAIGTESVPGGKAVFRWNGSGWERMPGGAVRIAVDPRGAAWVVTAASTIFRWTGSAWEQMPGGADDVGIGTDGTVWVIGGGGTPYKWTGSGWTAIDGGGESIAVDTRGQPWVVNAGGQIWRRNDAGTGWDLLPGSARDIAIAADGTAYVIGQGPGTVYRYDGTQWIADPGAAGTRIAAGPRGTVVVAGASGSLVATGPISAPAGAPAPAATGMVMVGGVNPMAGMVTSSAPAGSATQQVGTSSGQGTLSVGGGTSAQVPAAATHASQPLVVTGQYPPSVTPGSLVCSDGGEASFDICGKVTPILYGPYKAHWPTDCTDGSFYDLIFGGTCWKCDGTRTGEKVDSEEACAKEELFAAAKVRSGVLVAWDCPAQSFWDGYNGGGCYNCGDGKRTGYHIDTDKACSMLVNSPAQFIKNLGCPGQTSWEIGKPRPWVQNLAACMACPVLDEATGEVLVSEQWIGGPQCKVRFRWKPAVIKGKRIGGTSYADALPGSGALVHEVIADHEQVSAYLKFRALEVGTPAAEIPAFVERHWADIVANPGQSPTVKAMLFTRVLDALASPKASRTPEEQSAIDGFAAHVQAVRQTAAMDALQMYKQWKKSVDDLRQQRKSNLGDLLYYGTVPLDFDTASQAVAAGTAVGLGGFGITGSYAGYLANIGSMTIRQVQKASAVSRTAGEKFVVDRALLGGVQQSTTKAGTSVVRQARTVQQVATQVQRVAKATAVTKNLNGLTQSTRAVTNMLRAGSIADDVANGGKALVTSARAAIAGVTAAGAGVTIITAVAGILLEIAIDDFVAITTAEQVLNDKVEAASQPVVLENMLDADTTGAQLGFLWSTMMDAPGNPEPDLVTAAQAAAAAAKAAGYPTGATFGPASGRGSDVARSEDGTVWAIGQGGAIVRRGPADADWITLPGNAARVSVGRGDDAWVVNGTGEIYAWRSGAWSQVCDAQAPSCGGMGPAADVAVSGTGAVWAVSRTGALYRQDGATWFPVFTPVPAKSVDAASEAIAAIVGNDKKVYVLLGDSWVDLGTPPALDVAVDETGTVWAAWVEGGISYLRPGAGLWQDIRLPGAYAAIATGEYPVVASTSSEIRIANPGFAAR